jgi:glycosyltransferase involved in cell wall biosynthesis
MRIGVFDPYLDDVGGGEKYMMLLAECLAKKHDVTVFWDSDEDFIAVKKRFNLSLDQVKRTQSIFSPGFNIFHKVKALQNYDAFIILSDGSIPFVFPKKLFLHIQQPLVRGHLRFKDKIKLKHISAIFYNSQFTKQFNDQLFSGVNSVVIYPPVSLQNFKDNHLRLIKKEKIIIHVGRFRVKNLAVGDYKKQGFMVDSFKKLVDEGLKGWKFILASSVKDEDMQAFNVLKTNAKNYPIEFQVNKSNREVFEIYAKAKIYWHASGFGENLELHPELAEHFGMTTVEAMGAGVVPVVINAGGQKEIVTNEKDGLLWDTQEELLSMTNRLIDNESLWHKLSENAKQHAKDFTKEKFEESINKLIK